MSQLGRISGPLLEANLLRDGIDLTFRNYANGNDILYLDVTNRRISVNTLGYSELNVADTTHTNNLISGTGADIASFLISTNTVATLTGPIIIEPNQTSPLVTMDHMQAGDLDFKDNKISNSQLNGSISLTPSGTGIVDIVSSARVNGDLTVTGDFQINGNLSEAQNIIVGDSPLDIVTIQTDFTQSIIPGDNLAYDLGKSNKRWRNIWSHGNGNILNLTYNSFTISDQLQVNGPTATITTLQSNDTVSLIPSTGITTIERIKIQGNSITNLDSNALTIASSGIGYVKFADTSSVVIPSGPDSERPASPEQGDTRWNTDRNYLECFDGTVWNTAAGVGTVTAAEMEELGNIYILVLG